MFLTYQKEWPCYWLPYTSLGSPFHLRVIFWHWSLDIRCHLTFFLWNIITSGYFHVSFFDLAFSIIVVLLVGKYLEPIWGSKEFLRFIAIVNLMVCLCMFALMIAAYFLSGSDKFLFPPQKWGAGEHENTQQQKGIPVYGVASFSGAIAGFVVAFKQLQPDYELSMFSIFGLRAKHYPSLLVVLHVILLVIGVHSFSSLYSIIGVYISWIYLRWFQRKGDGIVGDPSNEFAFASFFPEMTQPAIVKVTDIICFCSRRPPSLPKITGSSFQGSVHQVDPKVAERRRQKALQELETRMNEMKLAKSPTATAEKKSR